MNATSTFSADKVVALLLESIEHGTNIKWFLESLDNDGLSKLLDGCEDRGAVAEVCFALCDENGINLFTGETRGSIAPSPRGERGFGWDPIFIPEGYDQTWGEMEPDQQKATSMRRIALKKLQSFLN